MHLESNKQPEPAEASFHIWPVILLSEEETDLHHKLWALTVYEWLNVRYDKGSLDLETGPLKAVDLKKPDGSRIPSRVTPQPHGFSTWDRELLWICKILQTRTMAQSLIWCIGKGKSVLVRDQNTFKGVCDGHARQETTTLSAGVSEGSCIIGFLILWTIPFKNCIQEIPKHQNKRTIHQL